MKTLLTALTATTAMTLAAAPTMAQETDMADYCQNAFFSGDQSEDGMISTEESELMRDVVFDELDLNDDGSIAREEYVACTESMQQGGSEMMPSEDDQAFFANLDTDQDSTVTAREYFDQARMAYDDSMSDDGETVDLATGFQEPFIHIPQDTTAEALGIQDRQRFLDLAALTFAMTDKDLDGSLTEDEWFARANQYEVDISRVNQRFDSADSDGDNALTSDEFGTDWQAVTGAAMGKADKDGFTDQSKGIPSYYFYISAM